MFTEYILPKAVTAYNFTLKLWQSHRLHLAISKVLVAVFVLALIATAGNHFGLIHLPIHSQFFAVELAFTLLLIIELAALIFVIPRSIGKSIGKQFEILSLILLRSAFKEFSHIEGELVWDNLNNPVSKMIADAFAALLIFFLIGVYYDILKRNRLTENEADKAQFKAFKKLVALLLLLTFIGMGCTDIYHLYNYGEYKSSFNNLYTVLIFSDILIVLIAMRYTFNFYKIFRYSAYVLATVLIRISLTAPAYINALISVVAAIFIIVLTYVFNRFVAKEAQEKVEHHV